jgi:sulfate-transporting ATPase
VQAVDYVSLEVHPGEVVGLIGPNGAGKTTLIDAVTGFVTANEGSISLDGRRIEDQNATKRARLGLRRSFQSLELFEDISVEENIRAGSDLRASRLSWITDLFWPGHHELPPTALAAVREFELEPHLDETPEELPYGRRRLVGIARAVASGPSIVLLDEPAAGLDLGGREDLVSTLSTLAMDPASPATVLVSHHVEEIPPGFTHALLLRAGRVVADGSIGEVVTEQHLAETFDMPLVLTHEAGRWSARRRSRRRPSG